MKYCEVWWKRIILEAKLQRYDILKITQISDHMFDSITAGRENMDMMLPLIMLVMVIAHHSWATNDTLNGCTFCIRLRLSQFNSKLLNLKSREKVNLISRFIRYACEHENNLDKVWLRMTSDLYKLGESWSYLYSQQKESGLVFVFTFLIIHHHTLLMSRDQAK